MKFDLGQWHLLPGTEAIYPITVVDVEAERDALKAQVRRVLDAGCRTAEGVWWNHWHNRPGIWDHGKPCEQCAMMKTLVNMAAEPTKEQAT